MDLGRLPLPFDSFVICPMRRCRDTVNQDRDTMKTKIISKKTFAAGLSAFVALSVYLSPTVQAQDSRILTIARDSAEYAGGGKYCKLDDDIVEDFIIKVDARMAFLARDDYEKILARLEFKNLLDVYSVKEPKMGCEAFEASFLRARQALSE